MAVKKVETKFRIQKRVVVVVELDVPAENMDGALDMANSLELEQLIETPKGVEIQEYKLTTLAVISNERWGTDSCATC